MSFEVKNDVFNVSSGYKILNFSIDTAGIDQSFITNCKVIETKQSTYNIVDCTTIDCNTVQCNTVQCTTVNCTTINCTTINCTTIQCNEVRCSRCNNRDGYQADCQCDCCSDS